MSIIDDKEAALRTGGLDLGSVIEPEHAAGFGGYMKQFSGGRIYWHEVMGQEPHEVHGGILDVYLAHGAHDVVEETGERRFGFPLTDEEDSADRLHRVSRFEFGTIFWRG